MTQAKPYGTVLLKADAILNFLASSEAGQPLHIIAKETDMTNSTVSKILGTLELMDYVTRDNATKTYRLGSALVKFANQYLSDLDISKIAHPTLKKLHAELDETVHLSVREGDKILYVNKLESKRPIVVTTSKIGFSKPMYASAMGKAILAENSPEDIDGYLNRVPLIPFTANTITDAAALKKELANIRQQGYAIDNSEEQIEVFCIGTTLSYEGVNYGAFSVSMPAYRRTPELENHLIKLILESREEILKKLTRLYLYL